MSLSDFASIASIIQGIIVIVSVILVWFQLREEIKITKAANTQKFVEIYSPLNLLLIQDREMARLWLRGNKDFDKMDSIDKDRYLNLLYWYLIIHENIFHQWKNNLIDKETFESWTRDLEYFINLQQLSSRWNDLQKNYERSFVTHVTHIITQKFQD